VTRKTRLSKHSTNATWPAYLSRAFSSSQFFFCSHTNRNTAASTIVTSPTLKSRPKLTMDEHHNHPDQASPFDNMSQLLGKALPLSPKQQRMLDRLLNLRTLAYNVIGRSFTPDDDLTLDALLNVPRQLVRGEHMSEFDDARMVARMWIWQRVLSATLSDKGREKWAEFEGLVRWVQERAGDDVDVGVDGKEIVGMLRGAVVAVGAGDDDAFLDLWVHVKELVCNRQAKLA
jgi:hypothetical protein